MVDLDFAEPAAPAAAQAASASAEPLPDLDFSPPAAPPAPAMAAPTPIADADDGPALDLDLGSLGAPADAPVPPPSAMPAPARPAAAADEEAPLDLEISLPAPSAPTPPPAATEAAAPEQPAMPAPVAMAPEGEEAEPATPATTSAPFVTETMADLYAQQGHREEALRVYRALLEQRPGDSGILQKIARLEGDEAQRLAETALAPTTGPSIRELLVAIATRRPGYRPEFPSANGAHVGASVHPPEQATEPADAPAPGEGRSDQLGAALGFAAASAHDESAARVLASAFNMNGRTPAPMTAGTAARPATDDLSLRTVFKDGAPAPPPASFSFDQFFSQRASAEAHQVGGTEGQAAESVEEVAQFTQWLEGLKKR